MTFSGILSIFKTIKAAIGFVYWLSKKSREHQRAEETKQDQQAVEDFKTKNDQTGLEQAIGSPNAGKPSEHRDGVESRPNTH